MEVKTKQIRTVAFVVSNLQLSRKSKARIGSRVRASVSPAIAMPSQYLGCAPRRPEWMSLVHSELIDRAIISQKS